MTTRWLVGLIIAIASLRQLAFAQTDTPQQDQAATIAAWDAEFDRALAANKNKGSPHLRDELNIVVDMSTQSITVERAVLSDPGYSLAVCPKIVGTDSSVSVTDFSKVNPRLLMLMFSGIEGRAFICANSSFGRSIIELRKWYCGVNVECIKSEWANGRPRWGSHLDERFASNTVNGYTFEPYLGK